MSNSKTFSYIILIISAALYGIQLFGVSIMERNGFSLVETIVFLNLAVFIVLLPFIGKSYKNFFSFPLWMIIFYAIVCILIPVGMYAPIYLGVSMSLTLFILYTYPIWTSIFSVLYLGVKLTKVDLLAIVAIIIGILVLLAPWNEVTYSISGIIVALMGGILSAAWLICTSHFSKKGSKPTTIATFSAFYVSAAIILFLPILKKLLPDAEITGFNLNRDLQTYIYVFVFAVVALGGPNILFYLAAKKINNIHLGLILLSEIVIGSFLDIAFLGTPLTWNIVVGGAFILSANAIMIIFETEKD